MCKVVDAFSFVKRAKLTVLYIELIRFHLLVSCSFLHYGGKRHALKSISQSNSVLFPGES